MNPLQRSGGGHERLGAVSHYVGTPEKGIRRLDPNTANKRRVVGPNAWLYSGQ